MRDCRKWSSQGFTLIELLCVVVVLAVLLGLVFQVGESCMENARAARETAAAKALAVAYAAAAADNDGKLMRGYDDTAEAMNLPHSGPISAEAAHRYPFRLAPYFDDAIDGAILVNKNKQQIARLGGDQTYFRSLYPALGMNMSYVGGVYQTGELELKNENQDEVATHLSQVPKPSMLLVFASGGHGQGKDKVDGYFRLEPPAIRVNLWGEGEPTPKSSPDDFGHVDFRYHGRAVCAFLDGSVRLMDADQLRDMRYWAKNAQTSDEQGYRVSTTPPPPGRGTGRR